MSRDGPASSTLSERLAAKLEQDRRQVEELTLSEHRKLAQSFLDASKLEFDTIQHAILAQSLVTRQSLREMLRWPLWTAAGCLVIVLTSLMLLWAGSWWFRQELSELRTEVRSERRVLDELRKETHGLSFTRAETGTFLSLPAGTDLAQTYRCGELSCIKLGE